jgi:hypothetical protein
MVLIKREDALAFIKKTIETSYFSYYVNNKLVSVEDVETSKIDGSILVLNAEVLIQDSPNKEKLLDAIKKRSTSLILRRREVYRNKILAQESYVINIDAYGYWNNEVDINSVASEAIGAFYRHITDIYKKGLEESLNLKHINDVRSVVDNTKYICNLYDNNYYSNISIPPSLLEGKTYKLHYNSKPILIELNTKNKNENNKNDICKIQYRTLTIDNVFTEIYIIELVYKSINSYESLSTCAQLHELPEILEKIVSLNMSIKNILNR